MDWFQKYVFSSREKNKKLPPEAKINKFWLKVREKNNFVALLGEINNWLKKILPSPPLEI